MTKSSAKNGGGGKRDRGASSRDEASGLAAYRRKRDPGRTTEPFTAEHIDSATATRAGAFVCHLHDARRRHYDLRLQIGGVLKSFAVPRGPSLNPSDKRLAVNTEDHPLQYLDFEDVIPEGNYGAGAMIAWDIGRVQYLEGTAEQGLEAGKVDFVLSGHKLKGRFALVHSGKRSGREPNEWLLFKKADAFSRQDGDVLEEEPRSVFSGLTVDELPDKEAIAAAIEARAAELGAPEGDVDGQKLEPMLCAIADDRVEEADRFYELKLDGVRILADRRGDEVALRYRTRRLATVTYPEVARAVRALAASRVVLDGEIVAFDDQGRPNFQRLGRRIHAMRPRDVALAAADVSVAYIVFDLLQVGRRSLVGLPLWARKELLERLVPARGVIRWLDHIEGNGSRLLAFCKEQGLEGVVGKRKESPYRPGPKRTDDWLKVKCEREADCVVVGWAEGKGGRHPLGALEVATYRGERLILRGRVGSGLDERTIDELLERLQKLEVDKSPAEGAPPPGGGRRHCAAPEIVVSVRHSGWTDEGSFRHPVFRGIRPDIDPRACTAAPVDEALEEALVTPPAERPVLSPAASRRRVQVTNRDKVFWPDTGYTKGELVDYYDAIAPAMLPFLKNRPIVLVRYPDGIAGKNFFQWNVPRGTPAWIRTLRLSDEDGEEKHTFLVDDADGLVYIANLGCIPIHILAGREGSLGECDFLTVDFDLGPRPFRDGVTLALSLKELLDDIGLEGYPKTSGQSGLHVLIPLGPGVSFDAAKVLVELVGRLVQARHPDIATMERRVAGRGDRVYIDTGQTGRARTIVAPYSVRAHPGATVSTPLSWDEVHLSLDPMEFTMFTVVDRAANKGDPMAGLLESRPDIAGAVARLERRVGG